MTIQHEPGATMDPALLIRHLHDELDAEAHAVLEAHLAACEECRSLASSLATSSRRVRAVLTAADFAPPGDDEWQRVRDTVARAAHEVRPFARPPARCAAYTDVVPRERRTGRTRRWLLQAAAVAGVIGAAAFALSAPLRAWVTERWHDVVGRPVAMDERTIAPVGFAAIGFPTAGPEVEIVFAVAQPAGTLRLRFTHDAGVARIAVSAGGPEQFVVRSAGVHIANAPGGVATYEATLPREVQRAAIRIGDMPVLVARTDTPVIIDLASGRVRIPAPRDHP
jgi:hypothetical protein